ncbi:palmdelphin [Aulostomus maculatus]
MEEADLLKERLQAITDKRRIQQDIAKKRREIEEEKLKLQYIKKKALREQWLMDGLSQQSEEEQEAMRLQVQDEQQQSDQLQRNISRIEKEIEALEAQELNISANEEVILKRLKEVERTAEDIIKELNADLCTDVTRPPRSPLPDIPVVTQLTPVKPAPAGEEPKRATFAMEISVEHDKRTGRSQVVSTATVSPESVQRRGLKVFDDGHKTVYALNPDGRSMPGGSVSEMTPGQVEQLLQQATDRNVPSEVQYHQPVYSASYTGTSRPSTPRTPQKTPGPLLSATSLTNGVQKRPSHELEGLMSQSKTLSPNLTQADATSELPRHGDDAKQSNAHIPGPSESDEPRPPQLGSPCVSAKPDQVLANNQPALVSVKVWSEAASAPMQPVYQTVEDLRPSPASHKPEEGPDTPVDSVNSPERVSSRNLVQTLPTELESEPVTMIFMGYENVDEDEEEDFQAELVVIGNSDEDDNNDAKYVQGENVEGNLSYHPEGYTSRVFQPRVGLGKVSGCRDIMEGVYTDWSHAGLHKPTFIHRPANVEVRGVEPRNKGVNMEKLCSTGR